MDKLRILSGDELVARGTTKIDGSLPEIGLKDVIPNGSWLEQKQIQSALEARKHLIDVERIEKSGVLSQAEWREELMLAEVTHKVGGHWQYVGHNVGKQLFLNPEEALYLMEVNCLQLKHSEVTVSLQQAYALLLPTQKSLTLYKVYSSLSRVGYKVFRHDMKSTQTTAYEKKHINPCVENLDKQGNDADITEVSELEKYNDGTQNDGNEMIVEERADGSVKENVETITMDIDNTEDKENNNGYITENISSEENIKVSTKTCLKTGEGPVEEDISVGVKENLGTNYQEEGGTSTQNTLGNEGSNICSSKVLENGVINENSITNVVGDCSGTNGSPIDCDEHVVNSPPLKYQSKLEILENRKLKPIDSEALHRSFKCIPDLLQEVVTVKVPDEQMIPKNLTFNNTTYVLNIERMKKITKNTRATSSESSSYSMPQEVNGIHVRRVRDSSVPNSPQPQRHQSWSTSFRSTPRFESFQFRPFWRPDFFHLNMVFNRPFMPPHMGFSPRPNFLFRPPPPPLYGNVPHHNNFNTHNFYNRNMRGNPRKRTRDSKKSHLDAIKRLAVRLSQLVQSGNMDTLNVESLQRLIHTYNTRYKTSIRLSDQFEIVDETIVETIELDCEDDSARKKPRTVPVNNRYEENLNRLKQLALKLKEMESKEKACGRHRRAFSNVIKRFNKSYNADVYLNNNYEISDRFQVNLDSSDSDCVIEETPNQSTPGKKLKNPFNILKRLSEKQANTLQPTTSKQGSIDKEIGVRNRSYPEFFVKTFNKCWLPDENDFGRAEVIPRKVMYNNVLDHKREEYMYEFLKTQPHNFESWLHIKISFLRSITLSAEDYTNGIVEEDICGLTSIIGPKDCSDMPTVLKKLSIIKTNAVVPIESCLTIDFDVYNRDVQNFRKTNRPKPHFRVICVNESTHLPPGSDLSALHSAYRETAVLFAVVGAASVSYVQANPTQLPVYVPTSERF